jgi:hypothetical protein
MSKKTNNDLILFLQMEPNLTFSKAIDKAIRLVTVTKVKSKPFFLSNTKAALTSSYGRLQEECAFS